MSACPVCGFSRMTEFSDCPACQASIHHPERERYRVSRVWLTLQEASRITGFPQQSIRLALEAGRMRGRKRAGEQLVHREDL